jgi:hypothetical protein
MENIYLLPDVFTWSCWNSGGTINDESRVQRPYALVSHAESLTHGLPTEFEIADAVANLKRAINHRLQLLEENYSFAKAFPKNVGVLERLEKVNLARPYLIKQLFSLRNDIEHYDAPPPSLGRCRELIDLTWYFLKATDAASRTVSDTLEYTCVSDDDSEKPELEFTAKLISVEERKFDISGWFKPPFINYDNNGFRVNVEAISARPEKPKYHKRLDTMIFDLNGNRGEDERWVQGKLIVSSETIYRFWSNVFK